MVMRETLDGFQGGLYEIQVGWRMMNMNLRYADDIILLAASETELQELVDRLQTDSAANTAYSSTLTRPK